MKTFQQTPPRRNRAFLPLLASRWAPLISEWVRRRLVFNDLEQYNELMKLSHPSFLWMNFGMDGPDFAWLRPEDMEWRYQVNMARYNLRGIDLTGKRFLDTGSGRGGNCWYVKRYHAASRVVGLEQNKAQVKWCVARFRDTGIEFKRGDSQKMSFRGGSFDVVSNIESAGHYPDRRRFYRGVHRVLSPSGYFCMTCSYANPDAEERAVRNEGFELVDGTDITAAVVDALRKNDENIRQLMQRITDTEETRRLGTALCDTLASLPQRLFLSRREKYYSWIFRKQ
jgi:O-methyltransferase